jgi:hypothetical protein
VDQHTLLLVKNILERPAGFDWSVQGLGMMRIYLSDEVRLHIWDSRLKVPAVSAIHSHPWDLTSLVVAGHYKQHRYVFPGRYDVGEEFQCATIKCGENACVTQEPETVALAEGSLEIYKAGQDYFQSKDEIHLSIPEDGTVTLVTRTFHADRDHAKVYWRGRGAWVDAKPRPAMEEEVKAVTQHALEAWF